MHRISGLSDELLIKLLLLLPTKDAVSTSILSKRWESLWMWLPKLEFARESGSKSLSCLLNSSMPLHRAPVIESFSLCFGDEDCKPEDVRMWVVVAVSRYLRELDISYFARPDWQKILPNSLYASKSLVVLKLTGDILLNVPRRMVSLPCLKTLELEVTDLDGDSLGRLLAICPLLESLEVEFAYENMGKVIIVIPSLQRLSLTILSYCYHDELKIDTPCLKCLKLEDRNDENQFYLIEYMPKLEEAEVHFKNLNMTTIFGSDHICQTSYIMLRDCSYDLLAQLLKDSPNLLVLDISRFQDHDDSMATHLWNQPTTVPACLVTSLETFSWSGYLGILEDISVAVYILQNANRLKTASFVSDETFTPKLEMTKALLRSARASTTCEIDFD